LERRYFASISDRVDLELPKWQSVWENASAGENAAGTTVLLF